MSRPNGPVSRPAASEPNQRPTWAIGPSEFAESAPMRIAGVNGVAPARQAPGTELWYFGSGLEQMQKIERREPFSRVGLLGGQMGDGFVLTRAPGLPPYESNATHEAELEVAAGALRYAKAFRRDGTLYTIAWGCFCASDLCRLLRYYPLGDAFGAPGA